MIRAMRINFIDPAQDGKWDAFVDEHPDSNFFHSGAWASVIKTAYGYQPAYCVVIDDHDRITAGCSFFVVDNFPLKRRLVSLPFSDFCPPLCSLPGHWAMLVSTIIKYARDHGINGIEIRGQLPGVPENCAVTNDYVDFVIPLDGGFEDRISRRFKRYLRNVCEPNLSITIGSSEDDMHAFYRLNLLTRHKLGVFPQSFHFFRAIHRHVMAAGLGFVATARYRGRAVASGLYFMHRNTVYHKYTGTDLRFDHLRGNHFLVWMIMKYALDRGMRFYDFGRTVNTNHGLIRFKTNWGAKAIGIPYCYIPGRQGTSSVNEESAKYRIATWIIRRLPMSATTFVGGRVYRYLA
ncbi:MAG TPA: peptidoglycan bridge formation glycyltransferase FemA/FemB family protein [bacterium]